MHHLSSRRSSNGESSGIELSSGKPAISQFPSRSVCYELQWTPSLERSEESHTLVLRFHGKSYQRGGEMIPRNPVSYGVVHVQCLMTAHAPSSAILRLGRSSGLQMTPIVRYRPHFFLYQRTPSKSGLCESWVKTPSVRKIPI